MMTDDTPSVSVRTKPAGLVLTHPCGAVADNKGGSWPRDQFFSRRLVDGDIEEIKKAPAEEPSGEVGKSDKKKG